MRFRIAKHAHGQWAVKCKNTILYIASTPEQAKYVKRQMERASHYHRTHRV